MRFLFDPALSQDVEALAWEIAGSGHPGSQYIGPPNCRSAERFGTRVAHGACPPPEYNQRSTAAGLWLLTATTGTASDLASLAPFCTPHCCRPCPVCISRNRPAWPTLPHRLRNSPLARGSGSAFTTERNLDTERPKKRLYATQVAGEGAGIFRPTGAVLGIRSLLRSTLARRRSAALPVQEGRSLMNSRRDRGHHRPPIRSSLARGMRLMR